MFSFNQSRKMFAFVSLILTFTFSQTDACSRVLVSNDQEGIVIVGRNMDWFEEMDSNIIFYPKTVFRSGGDLGTHNEKWISWVSKYATIVATGYENFTTDGMNETGFAAHILWLEDSDYGLRDLSVPGLSLTLWTQYFLDNFATVREAVEHAYHCSFQVVPFFHAGTQQWGKLHLVLDDATGDSAILEYVNGRLQIHHSRNFTVVTNEPVYEEQLRNLKNYKPFGGHKPLPGGTDSIDRFARATHFTNTLCPSSHAEGVMTGVLSVLSNASQPYGNEGDRTIWRTLSDLTNKIYYFQSTPSQNLISIKFNSFDQNNSASMKLDLVNHPEYQGEVSHLFETIR